MDRRKQAQWGRIGGLVRASRYPAVELTRHAREGFMERFRQEVDPNETLPPEEREQRALAARAAYMKRLAMKSWEKRHAATHDRLRAAVSDS